MNRSMKPTFLRMPGERAVQLKALAKARDMTMTDLISTLINDAITAGELPDQTPGFWISVPDVPVGKPRVEFEMNGYSMRVPPNGARDLADALEAVVSTPSIYDAMLDEIMVTVQRQGPGVVIEVTLDEKLRRVVSPSIALDVARQLRNAAAEAEKSQARPRNS